jgi:DNA-binding response OmpR family regulator
MRVLVVEDDNKIAEFVSHGLKQAGFATDCASNGEDGLQMALTGHYDAAVIDLMLPGLDGLSLIEKLRQQKINTPVIILSAKRSVDDRIKGLQAGATIIWSSPSPSPNCWHGCKLCFDAPPERQTRRQHG